MDGYITIGTDLDTKSFDAQINYIESQIQEIEDKLKQADMGFEVGDTLKLEAQYEKLIEKLKTLKQKKEDLNKTDLSSVQKSIDSIGNSLTKTISKVTKWGLAVFGLRSAYSSIRSAMSTLSQYDEQQAVNIQYISYLLASTLKPVIEGLIQLAYKLLAYVNYIAKAWFKVDLFANASTEAFGKNNKILSKSVKKAKELTNQLTGFDEMNVLQENGDVNSGGGGGGVSLPDFPSMEDVPIPSWLDWILNNGDTVSAIIAGIAGALISLKLLGLDPLMSLGIGMAITGIILLIQDIIDFIKDPSWDGFANILRDLALVLGGVAIAMLAVNAANPIAWIMLAIAAFAALASFVIKHWEDIKKVLGQIGSWIYEHVIKPVADFFVGLWNGFKNGAQNAWNGIKNIFSNVTSFFKSIFSNAWSAVKNVFSTGGKIFDGIKDGIVNGFKTIVNAIISGINKVVAIPFNAINSILKKIHDINILGVKPFTFIKTFSVPQLPKLAKGGVINLPGRGVPVGQAIGGERGQEGVIPLTDSQQMALLGEAIGKYININATVPVYVGNRQIAREIKKINAESDFAFNR